MHSSAIKRNTQIWCHVTNLLISPQCSGKTGLNVTQMIWVALHLELFIPPSAGRMQFFPVMALCIINCYARACWGCVREMLRSVPISCSLGGSFKVKKEPLLFVSRSLLSMRRVRVQRRNRDLLTSSLTDVSALGFSFTLTVPDFSRLQLSSWMSEVTPGWFPPKGTRPPDPQHRLLRDT